MSVMTTERDLDRCARGKHKFELSISDNGDRWLVCPHCRQRDPLFGCQFYVSPEQPECGEDSVTKVTVNSKGYRATVELCAQHKAVHDDNFARARKTRTSTTEGEA